MASPDISTCGTRAGKLDFVQVGCAGFDRRRSVVKLPLGRIADEGEAAILGRLEVFVMASPRTGSLTNTAMLFERRLGAIFLTSPVAPNFIAHV